MPSDDEMVQVYAAASLMEADLVGSALRAHRFPHVLQGMGPHEFNVGLMDTLQAPRVLVPRSRLTEARELLMSLGFGESDDEGPSDRECFERVVDAIGTSEAEPLAVLWAAAPEDFGDWMAASLPDLFERMPADAVLSVLAPLEQPGQKEHRAALEHAVADAPAITRAAITDALHREGAPSPRSLRSLRASLLGALGQ